LLVIGAIIISRLYAIQVLGREKWVAMAETQHMVAQALRAERGNIALKDHDGTYPVAVNREYKTVYVIPKLVEDVAGTAVALSSVLGVDEGIIRERLSDRADPFEVIKKKINVDEEAKLKELHLRGVNFLPETFRYYPAGELASKVIGFVGPGGEGEIGDSFRFKRIRDAVEAARESQKGKLKARGILEAAGLGNAWFAYCLRQDYRSACRVLEFSPETPLGIIQDFALENGLEANLILQAVKLDDSPSSDERILIDIVDKLVRYGSLSEKQMAFLTRLTKNLETLPEREAKKAEQREQWKAEKEQAESVGGL
jgi:hypothetical protein